MRNCSPARITRRGALYLWTLLLVAPAFGQVSVDVRPDGFVISNRGYESQKVHREEREDRGGKRWLVEDNLGNSYEVISTTGRDVPDPEEIIVVGGYQSRGGRDVPDPEDVIVAGGYQSALDYLVERYAAQVERDELLGVDLIALPGADDPLTRFFEIVLSDSLNGVALIDFFRQIEVVSRGAFDQPPAISAHPLGRPLSFPDDPFFRNQWNLHRTGLLEVQWHPARAVNPVRIALVDSGIGSGDREHEGLDGTAIEHIPIAPTTGMPSSHGLGILTILGDASSDGDGIVGLLGDAWMEDGEYANPPLFASARPVLASYNVGDFGPVSIYVARAIRTAVAQRADVINLSLALAYSPLVERAIRDAINSGVVVVAAAGNYHASARYRPARFPANVEGVIAVGGAGRSGRFSSFSAREGVDLLAPGEHLVVGGPGDSWIEAEGTSLAAPHVTAAVAVLRAVRPGLTPAEVLEALRATGSFEDREPPFLNAPGALDYVLEDSDRAVVPARASDAAEPNRLESTVDPAMEGGLYAPGGVVPASGATRIMGAFPNPFRQNAMIRLETADRIRVRLTVHNVLGQQVRLLVDRVLDPGIHEIPFAGEGLPSGPYLVRMEAGLSLSAWRIMLVR